MKKAFSCVEKSKCRFCGSSRLHRYIDLGEQPPSNSFIASEEVAHEQRFPLAVNMCRDCGLSQLTHVVSAKDIFDEYLYFSSTSRALVRHYQDLIDGIMRDYPPAAGALVVDVGANDGIMLDRYPAGCVKPVGVEPSSAGMIAEEKGYEIVSTFFGPETADGIVNRYGRAAVITMTNVFAHVDDIHPIVEGLSRLLDPEGVLVIEFPYLLEMIDNLYFDTIYHEHVSYLSVSPMKMLFAERRMRLIRARRVATGASGPAVQLFLCHEEASHRPDATVVELLQLEECWGITDVERYGKFAARVETRLTELRALVRELKSRGASIAAFSAPAKGNTLMNAAGFGPDDLAVVSENNAAKVGKVAPGTHIPIVSDEEFMASRYDYALLLAWNYADFFVANSAYVKQGGYFIVPLPELRVAPAGGPSSV